MVADIHRALGECFNTQPPEGGWFNALSLLREPQGFNTQPPEGGWPDPSSTVPPCEWFQHTAA